MSWLSTLRSASGENWRRATREVLVIAAICLIPLICRAAYYYFKLRETPEAISFFEAIIRHVISGELLFFSIGNFAAVIWLSCQDFKTRFDERVYFVLLSAIGLSVCTFVIGFNPTLQGIPVDVLRILSILTFIASLIANIFLLVFESYSGVDFNATAAHEEDETIAGLARRRQK